MRKNGLSSALWITSLFLSPALFAQAPNAGTPAQKPSIAFPQALEAKGTGVKLYSLYDENSPAIRELAANEVLIAQSEKSGWYEVEVPGSYSCWIYSQYLDEKGALGMGIVSSDGVRIRALPTRDNNYPIGKISKGEQVRVLDHKGEWTQIQAPSTLRLWVRQSAVTPLGTPETVTARIDTLHAQSETQWKDRLAILATQREQEAKHAAARETFQKAEEAFALEKGKAQNANYSSVRLMYVEATVNADATMTEQIKDRLRSIDSLETVMKEKVGAQELERRANAMDEKVKTAKEKAMAEASGMINFTNSDKFIGRYDSAGWLKRGFSLTGGVYTIVKGGITICELSDPKGRYSLSDYVGHELGIKGRIVSGTGEAKRIEISKIEVLTAPN